MSIKWSESMILKFLELYNKHDCLWNHRLDKYKNKEARLKALRSIVQEMGIADLTVADVKNKIKIIRTMYKKEHSLVYKSRQSGKETEDLYVPKLFWYKRADLFLNGVTNTRESLSNLNIPHHDEAESNHKMIENEAEKPHESEFPTSTSATSGNLQEEAMRVENTETTSRSIPNQSGMVNVFRNSQSRKRKMTNDNISIINAVIDKLEKVVHSNKYKTEDEFDIFGKYVAVQLKQMPLYDAIVCQGQISTMILQKRLELLSQQTTPSSPTFSPSQHTNSPPSFANTIKEECWSPTSEPCNKEECREDSQDPFF